MPIIISTDNNEFEIKLGTEEIKFIDVLKTLPDTRDNRGKRHSLVFLIVTVVFATLMGRSKVSSIHRYMTNKIDWLREVTGFEDATVISRSHLPRMLTRLDWQDLNAVIHQCFDEKTAQIIEEEWVAIDGKVMRGTLKPGEKQAIVHAVSHESRIDVAQAQQVGDKSSEIPVVRELLKETGLEANKISLDAHHCNPETMSQVNQKGGFYLIQAKENQPKLLEKCRDSLKLLPLAETIEHELAHGRITTRQAVLYDFPVSEIDDRWNESGLKTLIVTRRESFEKSTQKSSDEFSFYLSNYQEESEQNTVETLANTIRKHWSVESNNWQLDVTFNEDRVQVKNGNQAQIMGKLRCFAMNLLRKSSSEVQNFQASIEKFIDSPDTLVSTLRQVNFL
ncbi:MAG: ISAs1 family transposase [Methyloprofundus sp.]|nr:ISAs1 family transposase [Methyloprofundus sp.]